MNKYIVAQSQPNNSRDHGLIYITYKTYDELEDFFTNNILFSEPGIRCSIDTGTLLKNIKTNKQQQFFIYSNDKIWMAITVKPA